MINLIALAVVVNCTNCAPVPPPPPPPTYCKHQKVCIVVTEEPKVKSHNPREELFDDDDYITFYFGD